MNVFDALTPLAVRRLRTSVVSPFAQAYWDRLNDQGYAPSTVRLYLNCLAHFAHWAFRQQVEFSALDRHIKHFVDWHLPRCRCSPPVQRTRPSVRSALEHFKIVVSDAGVRLDTEPLSQVDEQLLRFDRYLLQMKGLAVSTRRRRLVIVRPLASMANGFDGERREVSNTGSTQAVYTPGTVACQRCQCRRHGHGRAQLSSLPRVRR